MKYSMKNILLFFMLHLEFSRANQSSDDFISDLSYNVKLLFNELVKSRSLDESYNINLHHNKVQKIYRDDEFCYGYGPGRRSANRPKSVHKLRPGDIDIIAAMGDSLTAANGALATNIAQAVTEDRSVSWSIGGKGNWKVFLTLPNLLKVFNPNLYGYSSSPTGNSYGFDRNSKFNVAEASTLTKDAVRQAKVLVQRMLTDRNVDIRNDWKLITIMTGSNDFCKDSCIKQESSIEAGRLNLIEALMILKRNLPRTLINLVLPVDPNIIHNMHEIPLECNVLHQIECQCMVNPVFQQRLERTRNTINKWKNMIHEVAILPEFHTNDFDVTLIKFTNFFDINYNGRTDYSILSADCFHLSQKGQQIFAVNLWNSMLTKECQRTYYGDVFNLKLKCPTNQMPYLRTSRN